MLLWTAPALGAAQAHVQGFVTQIDSATAFDVGTLHVTFNQPCKLQLTQTYWRTNDTWMWAFYPAIAGPLRRDKSTFMQCGAHNFAVGNYVHLYGNVRPNREFSATHILTFAVTGPKKLQGAALLEKQPKITRQLQGWSGTLWLDGYPMTVTPKTTMLSAAANTTIRYRLRGPAPKIKVSAHLHTRDHSAVFSPDLLQAGTWVTYKALRAADGSITATRLRFWPNQVGPKERAYLTSFAVTVDRPNYTNNIAGTIRYPNKKPIKILPNRAAQDWVSALGMDMVPQYQKELRDTGSTKIRFRFYIVEPFINLGTNFFVDTDGVRPYFRFLHRVVYNSPKPKTVVADVVAMPDGIILIPDSTLTRLQNRAQLAALLSFAIASVLQKQAYLAWPLITAPHIKFVNGIPESGSADGVGAFWTMQNEQVLRVGLHQMREAGYDIREAPYAWWAALGNPIENPIFSSTRSARMKPKIPWYAGYSMNFLSHYYAATDYSKLHKGATEYAKFLQELHGADPRLPQSATQQ